MSTLLATVRAGSDGGGLSLDAYTDQTAHFPHTRALLAQIARQHKPLDSYDSDAEGDDLTKIPNPFVTKVVSLLDQEHEDELKALLRNHYVGIDHDVLEQHVLDLMHRHRDDIAGVPFIFLAQSRRPISRPSSRASSHSVRLNRPDTPSSAPSSPLAYVFRRPHTPLASPLSTGQGHSSYMTGAAADSPSASPVLPYSLPQSYFATSLPASPLSSPRLLNAKASEFRPHPRPLSSASSNPGTFVGSRAETPSPDLWAHSTSRATSNLAIAAPLVPDSTLLSRSGTPSSLRASVRPGEYDEDNDPFDPFSKDVPAFPSLLASDYEPVWDQTNATPAVYGPFPEAISFDFNSPLPLSDESSQSPPDSVDDEANELLTGGMTPFDVLASVFGTTLAPSELEDALANNGYDFERAMAWLVDRMSPNQANHGPHHAKTQNVGGRVSVVSRDVTGGGFVRGGRSGHNIGGHRGNMRFGNGKPASGGSRVCRYFLAGECLRADCRFSHDLERALCRFWLRGTCAKGDACEFMHHLPQDVDMSALTNAMQQNSLRSNGSGSVESQAAASLEDFPSLEDGSRRPGYHNRNFSHHDPSRTRFSAAVKKVAATAPAFQPRDPATVAARREAMGSAADSIHHRTAIIAPKPSLRIKLRPPTLLPTLSTGESVNQLYMNYRARALQLGAARSACLSRAADAWRRGDGAAAKRFSREGHDLNAKMNTEMAQAASTLVRERAVLTQQAVKVRDPSWSDDPGDRTARGQACGAGLGVVLGIARTDLASDNGKLSSEERTEVVLDLHALHSNEAVEVLEEFLLALERDYFYGLAYLVVGEEKHTGSQNPSRGTSRARLAAGVREWLHRWSYPWSERDGVICVDPLTHL